MTNTVGDNFFKRSQRYRENPDYSPKHINLNWAVSDACDYVKPSAEQMQWKYVVSENTVPMHKAYNCYEDANLGWSDRMNNYEGPAEVDAQYQNNEMGYYLNSGGIGTSNAEYNQALKSI